jgi:hypothetical protein
MNSTRSLIFVAFSILLVFIAISFYYGIFSPPPLVTYTTDENFIGESGIFLFYGNTPRALEWAALPSTFIAYLLFLVWSSFSIISQISSIHGLTDILSIIDANAFYYLAHREEFVIWERVVQIVLIGLIIFKTVQFIINSKHPALNYDLKTILAVLCVCSDIIWVTVPLIRPEALSGSLFLLVTVKILFTERITPKIATTILILFILTVTQRLIFLFLGPFVVGGILTHFWKQNISWKTYFKYLGVVLLALFALMPFIVTDTLVVLKSFLGGVFIKLNHDKMDTYFNMTYINEFASKHLNIVLSLLSLVGTWFIIKKYPSKIILFLFLGNFLFFLFSSLKAAQLYVTHTFPLSMMAIILIGFGLTGILALVKGKSKKWVLIGFSLILIINSLYAVIKNNADIKEQQQNLADAIAWVKSLKNNEKIALELDFDGLIPKNKTTLMREYEANASENYRLGKLHRLLKVPQTDSLNKFALPIIAQSFAFEDEKLFDTQYQVALKYVDVDSQKRFDTDYFFENNSMMSHCLLREDALSRFDNGQYHYLISKAQLDNKKPLKTFLKTGGTGFWVYENKNFKP